jgi:hypothetical protein
MATSPDLLTQIRNQLGARLRELRPLLSEYERLLAAAAALDAPGADRSAPAAPQPPARAASKRASPRRGVASKRARRGTAATAIVAALEHGSHTASELAIVTAMRGPVITSNLRRLQQAGTIVRTKREGDGKAAYGLTSTPA